MGNRIEHRQRSTLAEGTLTVFHQFREVFNHIQIRLGSCSVQHILEKIHQYLGTLFAWCTATAAVERLNPLHILGGHFRNINRVVKKDNAVPSHKGTQRTFTIKGHRKLVRNSLRLDRFIPVIYNTPTPR